MEGWPICKRAMLLKRSVSNRFPQPKTIKRSSPPWIRISHRSYRSAATGTVRFWSYGPAEAQSAPRELSAVLAPIAIIEVNRSPAALVQASGSKQHTLMKKILLSLATFALLLAAPRMSKSADVSVDFFYNNLNGGSWVEVGDYGYCWQPDIAVNNAGWRPYADGYWAYTDLGW